MGDGDLGDIPPGEHRAASSPFFVGLLSLLAALVHQRYAEPLHALRAEKRRLLRAAAFAACAAFFSVMGIVALSFGVIALFWNRDRLMAVGGVIGFYWLLAAIFFWRWRVVVKRGSRLFDRR